MQPHPDCKIKHTVANKDISKHIISGLTQVFKAAFPFVLGTIIYLVILVYVPQIITWLPSMML
jgi:TRAP-type C4-dicarboxylate transport system permease large subunit